MRPWGEYLADHGLRARVPRLPGHGTSWQELNQVPWQAWYDEVHHAFAELDQQCDRVFVAGLSMGGSLALRLAQQWGDRVAGLLLVNPAVSLRNPVLPLLPALKRLVPSIPAIGGDIARPGADEVSYTRTPLRAVAQLVDLFADVRAGLARVNQPLLLFKSVRDHVVDETSAATILDRISSTDVEGVLLMHSYHVATVDHDDELIFRTSADFITRHGG